MAQNITLLGASFSDVPAVVLPKTGGGSAQFDDTTDANATAADIAENKTAYVNGVKVVGTAEGPALGTKSITQNGTYTAADEQLDGYSEVVVNVSGGGGQEVPEKDVNFIDYDGTVLYSYTAQEALALTALPANPSHEGLTAQGWNYTLAEVKTEVNAVGGATVGQMYVTDDGKTRIYFHLYEGRLEPGLVLYISGTVEVDWGDGSPTETFTSTILGYRHKYASAGDYVISIDVISGSANLYPAGGSTCQILRCYTSDSSPVYRNAITKVEIGTSMGIMASAFAYCYSIKAVTIPKSQSITTIDNNAFAYCYSLNSVVVPNSVTSINNNAFYYDYALTQCSLPPSVTSVGDSALSYCSALRRIIIPTGVTTLGATVAQYDYALEELLVADSVTSYTSNPLYGNAALHKYRISSNLTNFPGVSGCGSLSVLYVPDCGTSSSMMFNNNRGMSEYHFAATTPQALSSNGFNNIASDCKIYVPAASLSAYKSATNWSAYASKMVGE